ncbi:CDK2-associated and cullin domain-containing protein 1-like [Littorina saxatilis]|uniref:Cullin N-terminal domain-containing protein n=1 Tax=Littorina saxatilis TaxID=31220 RepID=A0AAN9BNZ0_9CAEN
MDEPMESAEPDAANNVEEGSNDNEKRQPAQLLRPGSMVMMTLTMEDYVSKYWPKLQGAIDQLLNMKPGAYIPISYEQMYSCVYKCVCKQFSERLYGDLIDHITRHVQTLSEQLQTHVNDAKEFVECFSYLMHQYLQALGGIVPIFNYLNRFYVQSKLKKDLNDELRSLFRVHTADKHIAHLLSLIDQASTTPFAIPPPTMASLIKNLYSLNPDYALANTELFARFIPNVLPPTNISDLSQYIEETHHLQQQLRRLPEYRPESSHKRSFEDDISVN